MAKTGNPSDFLWEDQVKRLLPLLFLGPKGKIRNKNQGFPLLTYW